MNASTLRDHLSSSKYFSDIQGIILGEVEPGKYPTQRGSFDLEIGPLMITICVWCNELKNTVEIQTTSLGTGEVTIQTLENATNEKCKEAVIAHIEKCS